MVSVAGNFRRRAEADRTALAPHRGAHRRAEQLQGVRQRFGVARLGAFTEQGRGERGHRLLACRLELVGAAEERDRERDERQVVLLGDDEVGAIGERALRPRRYAQLGRLRRWRDLLAIERLLRRRSNRQ